MRPVTWLFGLPSAGKTTLARGLCARWRATLPGQPVILLDGDELRSGLCADLGFSDADRTENVRRAAHTARLLADQGLWVACAFVTPTIQHRTLARSILGERLRLVHVDCPLKICMERDVKGLYARAAACQVRGLTGLQAPFEPPPDDTPRVFTQGKSVASSLAELRDILGAD